MHGDLRGFYGAPVTYALSIAVGTASSASLVFDQGRLLVLERDAILNRLQYWRLLTHQLAFHQLRVQCIANCLNARTFSQANTHTSAYGVAVACMNNHSGIAASFGLYIIFQFRIIERQMGSRKFGSILAFVVLLTSALELATLVSAPLLARQIPGGPYALLGALAVFFHKFVPKLYPRTFSFSGLNFSDKSSTYLLLLVMLGRNLHTLLQFAPGVLLGALFSTTPLAKLRLPSIVCTIFSVFHPLFDVVPASAIALQRQRRMLEAQRRLGIRNPNGAAAAGVAGQGFRDQLLPGAGGMMMGGGGGGGHHNDGMLPPQMAATPPPEDAIQQLMALGFEREQSIVALQASGNNVEGAANRLLNGL